VCLFPVLCQGEDEETDVRDVRWGVPQKQVIETEGREPDGETLLYHTTQYDVPVSLEYFFEHNTLFAAEMHPLKRDTSEQLYATYLRLAAILTEIHGKPAKHHRFSNEREQMMWETARTHILLAVSQNIWKLRYEAKEEE
jgi:hypothetical protein